MLREQIRKDIEKAVSRQFPATRDQIEVVRASEARFGDYTTNIAIKLASSLRQAAESGQPKAVSNKQSPAEIAKILTDSLKDLPYVKKLEVAGPGFINFFIKDEVIGQEIEKLLKQKTLKVGSNAQNVIVEFTDPNPFKEFHIGHLYSNTVGEAISRLIEATGANVKRANYQGDVGMHVAKSVWGMRTKIKGKKSKIKDINSLAGLSLEERARFLGEAYALGAKAFEENEEAKEEITKLNAEIYEKGLEIADYKAGRDWSLEYFEKIYKRLGTKFDFYYFESDVGKEGAELVQENVKNGVFIKSEGAIIFPGEKYGLHNRVFINSLGLPTYEAKELGLAPRKYKDFAYDKSIIVTGNEIAEYFKVLLAALGKIKPEFAQKTRHVAHGMVRMPGGKISSRLGKVLSGEWLLDEAKARILKEYKDVSKAVAEQIAVGAIKYALLKGNIGQNINFSFEESISLEGNSGPYLQYTHARCLSVLEKAEEEGGSANFEGITEEERQVLGTLGHFEETVADAASALAPNIVANYLYLLAQRFNTFYNNLPILKAGETERTRRLFLTRATEGFLRNGLYLLGISAPEKM